MVWESGLWVVVVHATLETIISVRLTGGLIFRSGTNTFSWAMNLRAIYSIMATKVVVSNHGTSDIVQMRLMLTMHSYDTVQNGVWSIYQKFEWY